MIQRLLKRQVLYEPAAANFGSIVFGSDTRDNCRAQSFVKEGLPIIYKAGDVTETPNGTISAHCGANEAGFLPFFAVFALAEQSGGASGAHYCPRGVIALASMKGGPAFFECRSLFALPEAREHAICRLLCFLCNALPSLSFLVIQRVV